MANYLNFNKIKKRFLTVELADEKNTKIMIGTPTKAIMDDLLSLRDSLIGVSGDNISADATDELYDSCARLMSRNKAGKKISKEYLEKIFDFEDILIFFGAYMEFLDGITNAKN